MRICELKITDLRIIENLCLQPDPGLNVITGANGSGKTSILEGIYLAGRGKTFRHNDAGPLIRRGCDSTVVMLEVHNEKDGNRTRLGVRRERQAFACRIDGRDVRKRSELAEALPVQWIGSQPQLLFSLGPEMRRRFIDMGLFHVEHTFLARLADFQRALLQRNAAIRRGSEIELASWDRPFSDAGVRIHESRRDFVASLSRRLQERLGRWDALPSPVELAYRKGWPAAADLSDVLFERRAQDLRQGFSGAGPHRADVIISAGDGLVEKTLSRGQQKLVVLALNLCLMEMVVESTGRLPILLIDDLAAELDARNRQRMIEELRFSGAQVFLTAIDAISVVRDEETTMFHVEHGALQ